MAAAKQKKALIPVSAFIKVVEPLYEAAVKNGEIDAEGAFKDNSIDKSWYDPVVTFQSKISEPSNGVRYYNCKWKIPGIEEATEFRALDVRQEGTIQPITSEDAAKWHNERFGSKQPKFPPKGRKDMDPCIEVHRWPESEMRKLEDGKRADGSREYKRGADGEYLQPPAETETEMYKFIRLVDAIRHGFLTRLRARNLIVEKKSKDTPKDAIIPPVMKFTQMTVTVYTGESKQAGNPRPNPIARIPVKFVKSNKEDNGQPGKDLKFLVKGDVVNGRPIPVAQIVVEDDKQSPVNANNIHRAMPFGTVSDIVFTLNGIAVSNMAISMPLRLKIVVNTLPVRLSLSADDMYDDFETTVAPTPANTPAKAADAPAAKAADAPAKAAANNGGAAKQVEGDASVDDDLL